MKPVYVCVVTLLPSPYQVELFDAIAAAGQLRLHVIYLQASEPGRQWQLPPLKHDHTLLPQGTGSASDAIRRADLVVMGNYTAPQARGWINERTKARRPWCLWGERPGFRSTGLLGRWVRWWRLRSLRKARGAIWGIGSWAITGWQAEFGSRQRYFNVPYYSNLERFQAAAGLRVQSAERRFLYSGALIPRKGVDLLARAFLQVASSRPHVRLDLVGAGPLETELRDRLSPLKDRVRLLGFRDWEDLPGTYAEADILCVPSRYDGWGLVVPEGMAAGLPVIATHRMGAALDLLESGRSGWLVHAGNEEELAAALGEAADLPSDLLEQRAKAGQARIERHQLADGVRTWTEAALATVA